MRFSVSTGPRPEPPLLDLLNEGQAVPSYPASRHRRGVFDILEFLKISHHSSSRSLERRPVVIGYEGDAVGAAAELPEEAGGGWVALKGKEDGVEGIVGPCGHGLVEEIDTLAFG